MSGVSVSRRTVACLLAAVGIQAVAAPVDDYAVQWPLQLSGPASGAYAVELGDEVYRHAHAPALRDVDVLNAQGAVVPAQLFAAGEAPAAARPGLLVALRWFDLPQAFVSRPDDWSMAVERDVHGRVLRLQARDTSPTVAEAGAWLVDASGLDQRIDALHLQWASGDEAIDRSYRVEASDDLQAWRVVSPQVQLVDLARGGERLRQGRVPLATSARYLRLMPEGGRGAPVLESVQAELAAGPVLPALHWQHLAPGAQASDAADAHVFRLEGRYPVTMVDIGYTGNGTARWTLYSRDDEKRPWRLRAGPWVAYEIGAGEGAGRSAPQALSSPVRDREWKLVADSERAPLPELRLGWRADTLVFVAEGPAPYRLVAGSARASRGDAPVAQALVGLARAHGADWRPGTATTAALQPLAGARALEPAAPVRDWRTWLLWSLLVAGAIVVAGLAASLLRKREG